MTVSYLSYAFASHLKSEIDWGSDVSKVISYIGLPVGYSGWVLHRTVTFALLSVAETLSV
jgi:hypothetical protein